MAVAREATEGLRFGSVVMIRSVGAALLALVPLHWGCGEPAVAPRERPPPDASSPVPCNVAGDACAQRFEVDRGVFLPVFGTHPLSAGHPGPTRGLVVVHGNARDADRYFETALAVVAAQGIADGAIVVAPRFQTAADAPAPDELHWSSGGWKRGHLSRPEGPTPRTSSYAALDAVLARLVDPDRFPALEELVVAGHSAGAQLVHRFAAASGAEEGVDRVEFRYVVANPSTYLYVGPEREDPSGAFAIPGGGCRDYDDWHYGLRNRNRYAGRLEVDALSARLERRDVRILIGDADTLNASLDLDCGARLQGANRFERGRAIVRFMDAKRPGHFHREFVVPGVGHSSRAMWLSDVGLRALWGR